MDANKQVYNIYISTRKDGSYGVYRDIPGRTGSREGISFPAGLPVAEGVKQFREGFDLEDVPFAFIYENEWDPTYKSYGAIFPPLKAEAIEKIKADYTAGTRIRLTLPMLDPNPVPIHTEGTITYVDDAGQIHMQWNNGRTLPLNILVDVFELISKQ